MIASTLEVSSDSQKALETIGPYRKYYFEPSQHQLEGIPNLDPCLRLEELSSEYKGSEVLFG